MQASPVVVPESSRSTPMQPPLPDVEDARLRSAVKGALFGTKDELRVGRFTLSRPIGSGAMGFVYEALDEELGRRVAVKLLHRENVKAGTHGPSRLLREARALARLSHRNVVTIHEVGEHEGRVFLAMELVRGPTLRDWLNEPRPWREILRVLRQAGEGIAAAHRAGLVHRDFKPDNVILDEEGNAVVLDFGLAVGPGEDDGDLETLPDGADAPRLQTRTGSTAGTPAYMAPERMQGAKVEREADQFSFGVTAWECLFTERPFHGSTSGELVTQALSGPPPRPRSEVPRSIVDAIRRALSPQPQDRWPSMSALLERLEPPRRRVRAWAAAGVASVVGVGLAAVTFAKPPVEQSAAVSSVMTPSEPAAVAAPPVSPWVEQTRLAITARDFERAQEGLAELYGEDQPAGAVPDPRSTVHATYLTVLGRLSGPPWVSHGPLMFLRLRGAGHSPSSALTIGVELAKQNMDPVMQARMEAMNELFEAVGDSTEVPRRRFEEQRDDLARGILGLASAERTAHVGDWSAVHNEIESIDASAAEALVTEPVLHERLTRLSILASAHLGDPDAAVKRAGEVVEAAQASGASPGRVATLRVNYAEVAAFAENFELAREQLRKARDSNEYLGRHNGLLARHAEVSLEAGDEKTAVRLAQEALEDINAFRTAPSSMAKPMNAVLGLVFVQSSRQVLAEVRLSHQQWDGVDEILQDDFSSPGNTDQLLMAAADLGRGDVNLAREHLKDIFDKEDASQYEYFRWLALSALVEIASGQRARGFAGLRDVARRERQLQGRGGSPRFRRWVAQLIERTEAGSVNPLRR